MTRLHLGIGPAAALVALLLGCGATTPSPVVAEEEAQDEEPETYAIALRLEDAGDDGQDPPHTRVALVRIEPDGARTIAELGREVGACYHQPIVGALIAARCWWAGAEALFEIRRDADAVVGLRTAIDEDTGEAVREEVARLEVPEDAVLQLLTPD